MIDRPNRGIGTSFSLDLEYMQNILPTIASDMPLHIYAEERQEEGHDLCTFVFCRGVHSQALSKKCEKETSLSSDYNVILLN